ncbi:MAG: TauD/TfdA family dioxygenase [Gammaproteobacteria bacterium]|nr:TauD/TfdA family dioxygenase [Rhodocyclaceae bacterium]MBU3909746.1 TauD/TfdA family dioxygenase [Gammaproteobacteria bacterium]MBU3989295.1 TauD/TfdA family dioxygenase [Gammaproteobacteria bacterium]MBU4005279.1 TauD/TfdA family dioxygenase [Gammaproteobacteria bacterium]MBU4022457.1 TauD/TfdA family dioxygenase [Gammaproteobacteria bacterium]
MSGCFDLADAQAYAQWRERKLDTAPRRLADIVVEIDDPRILQTAERQRFSDLNASCNMTVYVGKTGTDPDKQIPRQLGAQLGLLRIDSHWLTDDDAVSPISVSGAAERGERKEFIPYTDKPIKWHTDGYYNPPERTIRGLLLHCVHSAATGGANQLLDHEIAYILLRDENPDFIRALTAPDAMTIPPRMSEEGVARPAQPGPVFSVDSAGFLHMRYTARTVSIFWHCDPLTQAAVTALARILATSTWALQGRLEPGMGLVCNNVLHDRSRFTETPDQRRLLYRARYYDRVAAV